MASEIITPRPYQRDAIEAVWNYFRGHSEGNPLVVVPTGGGKSIILAALCQRIHAIDATQKILVMTHVRELVEQNAAKLEAMTEWGRVGVYCAGVGRKELQYPITVASVQSIANAIDKIGHVNLIIVDECHLIPKSGEGRYRKVIDALTKINPKIRIVGLSATPYRMNSGMLHKGDGRIFHDIAVNVGVQDLIDQKYLSPVRSKGARSEIDTSKVHVRGGEFVASELQDAVEDEDLAQRTCEEIATQSEGRKSILVFCSGIDHATMICGKLEEQGIESRCVFGHTPKIERDSIIKEFREGRLRCVVNVGVLTTGFDAPSLDCIVLLRPTMSPGLYYQMIGRGLRIAPGKKDCLVLDFAGNIMRHGPIDALASSGKSEVAKLGEEDKEPLLRICPQCLEFVAIQSKDCPECGFTFPIIEELKHEAVASEAAVLSRDVRPIEIEVDRVRYEKHISKKSGIASMKVTYEHNFFEEISEYICLEHGGFAAKKARDWWRHRLVHPTNQVPSDVDAAVRTAKRLLFETGSIVVKKDGKYWRVLNAKRKTYTDKFASDNH